MYENSVYEYIERIFPLIATALIEKKMPRSSGLVASSPPKKERKEMFSGVAAVRNGENKKKTSTRLNFHRLLKKRENMLFLGSGFPPFTIPATS